MADWRLPLLKLCAGYVRHVPPHRGHWRLAQLAVEWAPHLKNLKRPVVTRLKEGFRLVVDGTSQTGRIAYATGVYEHRTTKLIQVLVHAGDTVVDVGANIGYFSLVAARAVGPDGRVLAFEPAPDVRRALDENLRLNGIESVSVFTDALAATAGEVTFYVGPSRDTGLGSLRALDGGSELIVRQRRFDDLYDRNAPVTLVKIDVEGGEFGVLQGMAACLDRDHPHVILEVTDTFLRALGSSADQLRRFLAERGYRMWMIPEDGPFVPIDTSDELSSCPGQFNAVCTFGLDVNSLRV